MFYTLRCHYAKSSPTFRRTRFFRYLHSTTNRSTRILLSTLDPAKVTPDDHLDLSGNLLRTIYFSSLGTSETTSNQVPRFFSHTVNRYFARFLPNTKAFLVYDSPYPDQAPELGRLVLRLVSTPDPSLVCTAPLYIKPTTYYPWSISLFSIVSYNKYSAIERQLLKDGLVTSSLLDRCRELANICRPTDNTAILCSFDQPWLFDFSKTWQRFYIFRHGRLVLCRLPWTGAQEYTQPRQRALTGKAYVVFRRIYSRFYIRIVEVVEPVRYKAGDTELTLNAYMPGGFIPFRLTSPLQDLDAPLRRPNPVVYNSYRTSVKGPQAPWFADPRDCLYRGLSHMKYLRLFLDDPLTEEEERMLDVPLKEGIQPSESHSAT